MCIYNFTSCEVQSLGWGLGWGISGILIKLRNKFFSSGDEENSLSNGLLILKHETRSATRNINFAIFRLVRVRKTSRTHRSFGCSLSCR